MHFVTASAILSFILELKFTKSKQIIVDLTQKLKIFHSFPFSDCKLVTKMLGAQKSTEKLSVLFNFTIKLISSERSYLYGSPDSYFKGVFSSKYFQYF